MSRKMEVIVHDVATEGIPEMTGFDDALVGRVAFIFDGCIVSGWPMVEEDGGIPTDDNDNPLWEGNHDVARHTLFANVTHWVEFPVPVWEIER